jgi:hypothetical protein
VCVGERAAPSTCGMGDRSQAPALSADSFLMCEMGGSPVHLHKVIVSTHK